MEKLTSQEWKSLFEQKEEEIRETLKKQFKNACGRVGQFKCNNTVILDDDGEVRTSYETQNTTDGNVWNGNAKYVASFEDFNPLDFAEDEKEFIENSLTADELKEFKKYCEEEEQFPNISVVTQWKEEIGDRLEKEYIDNYIDFWTDDEIDRKIDNFLQFLEIQIDEEKIQSEY